MLRMLVVCIAPPHTECFGVPRQLRCPKPAYLKNKKAGEQQAQLFASYPPVQNHHSSQKKWRGGFVFVCALLQLSKDNIYLGRLLGCSTGFPESKCPHSSRSYVRLTESLFELDLLQEGLFAADIAPHNYHNRAELILRLR
ncbi:uncharacterized protein LOC135145699 isoform X1 [Zophobas morio]|uniref:uncharacterized protein LOC135145699 isoform X1 n=1 Tax=Zophobas morio TaxID=2755281 RepID=UPI003083B3DB